MNISEMELSKLVDKKDTETMVLTVPEKIKDKFHYSENGGYLDQPYTEEEKRVCDDFVAKLRRCADQEIMEEE